MPTLSTGNCRQLSSALVNLMHEFRHEVFVKRLKWSLPATDGVERDQYDTSSCQVRRSHRRHGSNHWHVRGCCRRWRATCCRSCFRSCSASRDTPRAPGIWELSRFATSVRETGEGRILSLSKPTLDFLEQVLECAQRHNIRRLIFVTSIGVERLMLRAGVPVHRIGPPALVDGQLTVALFIEVENEKAVAPAPCTHLIGHVAPECGGGSSLSYGLSRKYGRAPQSRAHRGGLNNAA